MIGLFMRTGAQPRDRTAGPDHKKGCCSAIDAGDARRVADRLDIPFYALDFEREFDADHRLFRRRIPRRADAQPLRRLQ